MRNSSGFFHDIILGFFFTGIFFTGIFRKNFFKKNRTKQFQIFFSTGIFRIVKKKSSRHFPVFPSRKYSENSG